MWVRSPVWCHMIWAFSGGILPARFTFYLCMYVYICVCVCVRKIRGTKGIFHTECPLYQEAAFPIDVQGDNVHDRLNYVKSEVPVSESGVFSPAKTPTPMATTVETLSRTLEGSTTEEGNFFKEDHERVMCSTYPVSVEKINDVWRMRDMLQWRGAHNFTMARCSFNKINSFKSIPAGMGP